MPDKSFCFRGDFECEIAFCDMGVRRKGFPVDPTEGEIGSQTLRELKADTGFSSVIVFASPVDLQEIHFVGREGVVYNEARGDKSLPNDTVRVALLGK